MVIQAKGEHPTTEGQTMKFEDYLDTRDLETAATETLETIADTEDATAEEIAEAKELLKAMKTALGDFGWSVEDSEIPWGWREVGDNLHVTLVRDDSIGEYWEERVEDWGLISKEAKEFLGDSVDWEEVAQNQDGTQGTFLYKGDEITYWIY